MRFVYLLGIVAPFVVLAVFIIRALGA